MANFDDRAPPCSGVSTTIWRLAWLLALPLAACDTGPVVTIFDGAYAGTAFNTSSPVFDCPPTQAANPMTVSGGLVSIGEFRGRVSPAGTVQMLSRQNRVGGQFGGDRFDGQLQLGPFSGSGVVCTYRLELARR